LRSPLITACPDPRQNIHHPGLIFVSGNSKAKVVLSSVTKIPK